MSEARYPIVVLTCSADAAEEAAAALWEEGAQGIEERDAASLLRSEMPNAITLIAHFENEASAQACVAALQANFQLRADAVVGDSWREAWKVYFKPSKVGAQLWICPSWERVPAQAKNDIVLQIDPGAAFGTGTHETTRLVLQTVEGLVKDDVSVLDVGCGSGILAIAAAKLGAKRIVAIDNDEQAIVVTKENAEINNVQNVIEASTKDITELSETFHLVLANIEYKVLSAMANELICRMKPEGTLVLSGLLAQQENDILACFPRLKKSAFYRENDWIALVLKL